MQKNEDAQYHRTAMARKTASAGLKAALQKGYIKEDAVVLDYGCGRGDDVSYLNAIGVDATGYDPNLPMGHAYGLMRRPPVALAAYDVVLCTYVLNVIEDLGLRETILRQAFEYVKPGGHLLVTVRAEGDTKPTPAWTRKGDGWLTSAGTFQKFWKDGELEDFASCVGPCVRVRVSKNSIAIWKGGQ